MTDIATPVASTEVPTPQQPIAPANVERTIELPQIMDDHLKAVARTLKVSKAELIRFFTVRGLIDIYDYFGTEVDKEKAQEVGDDIKETAELMPLPAKVPFA